MGRQKNSVFGVHVTGSDGEMDHSLICALVYPANTPVVVLEMHVCTVCKHTPLPKTGSKPFEAKM